MHQRTSHTAFGWQAIRWFILSGLVFLDTVHEEVLRACYLWAGINFFRSLLDSTIPKATLEERAYWYHLWRRLEQRIIAAGFMPVTPAAFLTFVDHPECLSLDRADANAAPIGYAPDYSFSETDVEVRSP